MRQDIELTRKRKEAKSGKELSNLNTVNIINGAVLDILPINNPNSEISRTRSELGEIGKNFTDDDIKRINAQFDFLSKYWLDEIEKNVFNGKTLKMINK